MPKIFINIEINRMKKIYYFLTLAIMLVSCSTDKQTINKDYYSQIIHKDELSIQLDSTQKSKLATNYLIKGSTLQQKFQYAQAILEFQQALRYDSASAIIYDIAKSYYNLDKLDLAEEFTLKSLRKDSKFIPAMELLSDINLDKKNYKNAITIYNEIIKIKPTKKRKIYFAALNELINKKKAILLFKSLIIEYGDDIDILTHLAKLYKETNQFQKQIGILEKITELSNEPRYSDELLRAYLYQKDFNKSLLFLKNSINNNFFDEDLNYFYSIVGNFFLQDTSFKDTAIIKQYLKQIDNRFYFDWRINLISAYLSDKIGDTNKIRYFLSQTMKSDTSADVPLSIATFYAGKENHRKSIEILKKYKNKFSDNSQFPYLIALSYMQLDSNNKALIYLHKALEIDSSNTDIWGQIGFIYDKLKKYDSCDYAYTKVLLMKPQDIVVNNNYAYSLSERGVRLNEALKMSSKAIKAEPNNPVYLDTYAWIEYKLGDFKSALENLLAALKIENKNPEMFIHLGHIYLKLQLKNKAIMAWETALKLDSDNAELKELIKELTN